MLHYLRKRFFRKGFDSGEIYVVAHGNLTRNEIGRGVFPSNSKYVVCLRKHFAGKHCHYSKHAFNRPVYFRDLCTHCLQRTTTKILPHHISTHVCKFLSSKITHVKKKCWILTKTFSNEICIETNNIFAIRGKKNPSYFNFVRANKPHNSCHKAYAFK